MFSHCNMTTGSCYKFSVSAWEFSKRAAGRWEHSAAKAADRGLRDPWIMRSAGRWLSAMTAIKATTDAAAERWWAAVGLPTKRDQERQLHLLNELHSRVLDLEERAPTPGADRG